MELESSFQAETERSDSTTLKHLDRPYPNLQVTQSMVKPRYLRKEKSGCVDPHYVLTRTFGYADYKGKQKEIVEAAVQGADILVIAPTGMGKSICFQVPALADKHGITLVVSPLLALIKDQVSRLKSLGVDARALTSETPQKEKAEIIKDILSGHPRCRLLYLTPEKLCGSDMTKHLQVVHEQQELNRLVVDEAHCISEWGNDFRPEYRRLGIFRQRFPNTPIMALTASATPAVQDDIIANLDLSSEYLLKVVHPFNRRNLFYEVRYAARPDSLATDICRLIQKLHDRRGTPSTGIIYCRTRQACDSLANFLQDRGLGAKPYHKGLSVHELNQTAKKWRTGGTGGTGVDVVCATTAFGLGIDKSDVRYVIHYDLPKSFEGYYQETGRAGRDGQLARCILYYSREDAVRVQALVRLSHSKRGVGPTAIKACETAEASLSALVKYAESTSLCRHIVICQYFGETIDPSNPEVAKAYCDGCCDVCKDPQKTSERKKALVSEEIISTKRAELTQGIRDEEEEEEEEETRAFGPNQVTLGFQQASEHLQGMAHPAPPFLALLGKRHRGGNDDNEIADTDRSSKIFKREPHVPIARRHRATFKIPSSITGPQAGSPGRLKGIGMKDRSVFYGNMPKRQSKARVEEPDTDDSVRRRESQAILRRSLTPENMPPDDETLEISFSQKIARGIREEAVAMLRKALWNGLEKAKTDDQLRQRVGKRLPQLGDTGRLALTNKGAHKLELILFSMCSSKEHYTFRASEQERAIQLAFSDDARAFAVWEDRPFDDEDVQNACDIVKVLQHIN